MVNYSCEKCGKTFKQKGHYIKHLQRKIPCDNIKDKIEKIVEKKVDELVKEKLQDLVEKGEIKNKNLISTNQKNNTEMEDKKKIDMIDLFAGTGAFSRAFEENGVKCCFANDFCKNSQTDYSCSDTQNTYPLSQIYTWNLHFVWVNNTPQDYSFPIHLILYNSGFFLACISD